MCFHIDNKTYHIFLCSRTLYCWRDCIEPNIIIDGSLRQRRILIIASDNYISSFLRSVRIINMNANRANFRRSFDILLCNFVYGTSTVLIHAVLHNLCQNLFVGQQLRSVYKELHADRETGC